MGEKNFEFLLYSSADEEVSVHALVKDETIWLTQKAMAELFGCSTDNISLHLKNIFADGELEENRTAEGIPVVQTEGTRQVNCKQKFYNLDAIISAGHRVNSRRAAQFRIWATGILKEYMTKGFVLDDERLKQGKTAFGTVKADKEKEHMGLTRWKNASDGRILKSDVAVAKNYLNEKQIRQLERAVIGYFDYVEDLIE